MAAWAEVGPARKVMKRIETNTKTDTIAPGKSAHSSPQQHTMLASQDTNIQSKPVKGQSLFVFLVCLFLIPLAVGARPACLPPVPEAVRQILGCLPTGRC